MTVLYILHDAHMLLSGNFVEFGSLQAIRAWHIIGRLGGCNSMNMQVSFPFLPWMSSFLLKHVHKNKKFSFKGISDKILLLIELASLLQLSQSPMDKRPSYDFIQGANVTPTTFYNIGDLEVQDNLARIWCSTNCIFLSC